jgi:hypothetical protein
MPDRERSSAAEPSSDLQVTEPRLNECNVMSEQSSLDIRQSQGSYRPMSSDKKVTPAPLNGNARRSKPAWAEGLKRMYDEVVDEQLPDEFTALLKKLDQASDGTH